MWLRILGSEALAYFEMTSLCFALWIVSGKHIMLEVSSNFTC
jgi:hypothetical protein